jgi:serine phosphatase RsbU (regulator of sigma subunit)
MEVPISLLTVIILTDMNYSLDDHPRLVRFLTLALVVVCLYMGGMNFYFIASVPTDENVFVDPPTPIFINTAAPARFEKELGLKLFGSEVQALTDALIPGDDVIEINGKQPKSLSDAHRLIGDRSSSDSVEVSVLRTSLNGQFLYRVPKSAFTDDFLVEHKNVVLVTSVLPGGASDRAGMKTGDMIFRINEQSFANAISADSLLRQGQVDKSLRYDINREGRLLSLQVTLAKFGVSIIVILSFCVALFYMGTGAFLVLKRPGLPAARLLGWGFIALSCLLMTISQGHQSNEMIVRVIRLVLVYWGIFGGVALFTHSFFYFPTERPALLANKWHRIIIYAISAISCAGVVITTSAYFFLGLVVMKVYYWVIRYLNREKTAAGPVVRLHDAGWRAWTTNLLGRIGSTLWPKSVMRAVRACFVIVAVLIFISFIVQQYVAGMAMLLATILIPSFVLFPLAYLYIIGRYQLLDMTLHIRRNLQYSVLTIVWNSGLVIAVVAVFFSLPNIVLPLENVEFTGASILITDAPVSASEYVRNEKIGSMLLGLAAVFGYVMIRRRGQKFIDEKYYQTQFDYRRALGDLSEALASKLGMEDLARGLVTTLVDLLKVKQASVLFFRNGEQCCCIESAGKELSDIECVCMANQAQLTRALNSISDSARVEYLPTTLRGTLEAAGIRIVLPVRSKNQLIGALLVGEKLSEAAFKDEDITFLNSAAMQASVSIENAFLYEELAEQERMKHELEIARKIQLASLPQNIPQVKGLDIAGASLPAMEVGGDFYDYLETDSQKITAVIGDVSGKGTSAALYMSKVQGILRSLFTFGLSPRDLFVRANRLLCRDLEKRSFVTVLGAEFDLAAGTVRIARAGHLPLYCYDATAQAVVKIVPPGIGLGLNDADQPFAMLEEFERRLSAGDVFLFVSDGITEAHDDKGDEYGDDRLCALLTSHAAAPAALVCETLLADVKNFAGSTPQHDDQTVVCITVKEL